MLLPVTAAAGVADAAAVTAAAVAAARGYGLPGGTIAIGAGRWCAIFFVGSWYVWPMGSWYVWLIGWLTESRKEKKRKLQQEKQVSA